MKEKQLIDVGIGKKQIKKDMIVLAVLMSDAQKKLLRLKKSISNSHKLLKFKVNFILSKINITSDSNYILEYRIKIDESKSNHVIFTIRPKNSLNKTLNNLLFLATQKICYLDLHLDWCLTWAHYTYAKRITFNNRF